MSRSEKSFSDFVNWDAFDRAEGFTPEIAARLWLELTPSEDDPVYKEQVRLLSEDLLLTISRMVTGQETNSILPALQRLGYRRIIPRKVLIFIANQRGEKPKFLFPENRTNESRSSKNRQTKKRVNPLGNLNNSWRKPYLILISSLLKSLKINISERSVAKKIVGMIDRSGNTLGITTVRTILKQIKFGDQEKNSGTRNKKNLKSYLILIDSFLQQIQVEQDKKIGLEEIKRMLEKTGNSLNDEVVLKVLQEIRVILKELD